MGGLVVLGEAARVKGFALAGATTIAAGDRSAIERAWADLPAETSLVVLTPAAAAVLGGRVLERGGVLTVTMPT